ncbi:hypothetical protein Rsub_06890 [Raphidocelis subcapitata]|uniref:Polysaccharide pyruvyl transferase domain-containing protein n=1 Tax=Raphidocelis subcapitata TaxID=307507 RepID=A0A2V0P1Y5_9CHLO|nr:hypothetical protein Rsub_06890 [Raphidocelis subcapitata]|eukprot:GBF93891.1 hypothetical protein Rsub_06890 [Raphidocelis subcapitata]
MHPANRVQPPAAAGHLQGPPLPGQRTVLTALDSVFRDRLPGFMASLEKARAGSDLEVLVFTLDDGGEHLDGLLAHFCAMRALHWPGLNLTFYAFEKNDMDALLPYTHGAKGILGHVSSATMLRLMAPEVLAQHGDVLYLDMDAMVVSPLEALWAGAACGRKFPAKRGRGTPLCAKSSLKSWAIKWMSDEAKCYLDMSFFTREFNAGVLIMDLVHMRKWGLSTCAVLMSRWFGLNDQVILNLYANATYAELAPEWNVFYNRDDQQIPANHWRILHSAGSTKPWNLDDTAHRWRPIWERAEPPGVLYVWSSLVKPFPEAAANNVAATARALPGRTVTVLCATAACINSVGTLRLPNVRVQQLRITQFMHESHPLAGWFRRHALIKVWSGKHYPAYFDTAVRLGALFSLGGVLLDWDLAVTSEFPAGLYATPWCQTLDGARALGAPAHSPVLRLFLKMLAAGFPGYTHGGTWPVAMHNLWHQACPFSQVLGDAKPELPDLPNYITQRPVSAPLEQPLPHFGAMWLDMRSRHLASVGNPAVNLGDEVQGIAAAQWLPYRPVSAPLEQPLPHFGAMWLDMRSRYLASVGNPAVNLGDEVQGIAAAQWLPYVDAHVERDDLALSLPGSAGAVTDGQITMFANAWYGTVNMTWPPSPRINPIMLAIHVEPKVLPLFSSPASVAYLKAHSPVGARDTATLEFFQSLGVETFLSRCMTLTMQPVVAKPKTNCPVVIVDVHPTALQFLPSDVARKACHVSPKFFDHGTGERLDGLARYGHAFSLLEEYASAGVLVTSRLHAALPALAMGVPVVLIITDRMPGGGGSADKNQRFSGLQELVHHVDLTALEDPADWFERFKWFAPPKNPGESELKKIRCQMLDHLSKHHPELVDSIRVFDASGVFSCEDLAAAGQNLQ